jgi:hypothetical protein
MTTQSSEDGTENIEEICEKPELNKTPQSLSMLVMLTNSVK